jgi:DNA-binding PadR family transcriptional regulator
MTVNATGAALLGLLRDGPLSGYALAQAAAQTLGDFWTVTRSQVYRELAAMAADGLVQAEQTGPRDRRPYRLTDEGRAAFSAWLHDEPGPDVVRIPLLLRLAFVDALDPEHLAGLSATQREAHARQLAGYREAEAAALAAGAPPGSLVTLRFGIRYETAVLAWFDEDLGPVAALRGEPAPPRTSS